MCLQFTNAKLILGPEICVPQTHITYMCLWFTNTKLILGTLHWSIPKTHLCLWLTGVNLWFVICDGWDMGMYLKHIWKEVWFNYLVHQRNHKCSCGGGSGSGSGGGGGGGGSTAASSIMTKTPAETAMPGGKTTINNKLKVVATTAMEMATITGMAMTMKQRQRQWWRGGQHGVGSGGSMAAAAELAAWQRQQQRGGNDRAGAEAKAVRGWWRRGSGTAAARAAAWQRRWQLGNGGGMAAEMAAAWWWQRQHGGSGSSSAKAMERWGHGGQWGGSTAAVVESLQRGAGAVAAWLACGGGGVFLWRQSF
jgi:hypothetical protein